MSKEPSNGSREALLKVNTIITSIILFVAAWLWQKVTTNAELLVRIDERQQYVLKTLPELWIRVEKLEKGKP